MDKNQILSALVGRGVVVMAQGQYFLACTREAVEGAVYELVENGTDNTVTTLEVKQHLRQQGYFTTQALISRTLAELSQEHHWPFVDNGSYRIYEVDVDSETEDRDGDCDGCCDSCVTMPTPPVSSPPVSTTRQPVRTVSMYDKNYVASKPTPIVRPSLSVPPVTYPQGRLTQVGPAYSVYSPKMPSFPANCQAFLDLVEDAEFEVDFTKLDGSRRVLRGNIPDGTVNNTPGLVTVWDKQAGGYRQFHISKLNSLRVFDRD